MPIQNNTEHLQLPLPHPDNDLEDDVPRIIEALSMLDAALFLLQELLGSRAGELDDRVDRLEWYAARASGVSYNYDEQGRVSTITATVNGAARVTTYTYDANGRISTAAYVTAVGATRTETYNYDQQTGRLAGVTAMEVMP